MWFRTAGNAGQPAYVNPDNGAMLGAGEDGAGLWHMYLSGPQFGNLPLELHGSYSDAGGAGAAVVKLASVSGTALDDVDIQ